jgi:hypothetical protein
MFSVREFTTLFYHSFHFFILNGQMKGSVSFIQLLGRCFRRDFQLLQHKLTRQQKQRSLNLNNQLCLYIQKPIMGKQKPFKGKISASSEDNCASSEDNDLLFTHDLLLFSF